MTRSAIVLFALLASPMLPLAAQEAHEHESAASEHQLTGMMEPCMDMMSMMSTRPEALLDSGERLGLDEAQKTELQQIRDLYSGPHSEHMMAARSQWKTAGQAIGGDTPAWENYVTALTESAKHRALAHVAMVRASSEAKEVLTTQQLEMTGSGMSMMQHGESVGPMDQGAMCHEMMGRHMNEEDKGHRAGASGNHNQR